MSSSKADLERQTEELAKQLQHAIDHWDDPDQVAARAKYLQEKEDHQRDVFERSYLRTGQKKPSDSMEEAVGKMLRVFAEDLETTEERTQPLPKLETGEDVSLVVMTSDGKQHILELIVEKGSSIAKEVLVRGTMGQVLALLRARQSAEYIVLFTERLRGKL